MPNSAELYYETANANSPPTMAALLKFAPLSQVLFGSDHPYVSDGDNMVDLKSCGLTQAQMNAILYENARAADPGTEDVRGEREDRRAGSPRYKKTRFGRPLRLPSRFFHARTHLLRQFEGVHLGGRVVSAAACAAADEVGRVAHRGRAMRMQARRRLGQLAPTVGLRIKGLELVKRDAFRRVLAFATVVQDQAMIHGRGAAAARRRHRCERAPTVRLRDHRHRANRHCPPWR